MVERQTIVFSSSFDDLFEANDSFDKGVLRIAYHGMNRNNTYISKDTFEDAIPSMYNCPIVCHYTFEDDSIGAHDVEIRKRGDQIKVVNVTEPVGVIPESAQWWWQEIVEDNGDTHEYLCAEVLIWRRQAAYEHIKQNGETDHSMEIAIKSGYLNDDRVYVISQFEFTAFCLLEREAPCFESSGFEAFSHRHFENRYTAMMEDFKREFAKASACASASAGEQNSPKGGVEEMNLGDMMEKYNLVEGDINFEIEGMSPEDIEAKFAELQAAKNEQHAEFSDDDSDGNDAEGSESEVNADVADDANADANDDDDAAEGAEDDATRKTTDYSLTNAQLESEIRRTVMSCRYQHPDYGDMPRYWMLDFDMTRGEVYVEDNTDYRLYGLAFAMNGDTPVVDFESRRRKKVEYSDWNEGSAEFSVHKVVEDVVAMYTSKIEELEARTDELAKFQKERLDNDRRQQNEGVFSMFADLSGNERFDEIKNRMNEDCYCMTLEELEDKCFAIRGRCGAAKFSVNNADRLPIENAGAASSDEPYNGCFLKYGKYRK